MDRLPASPSNQLRDSEGSATRAVQSSPRSPNERSTGATIVLPQAPALPLIENRHPAQGRSDKRRPVAADDAVAVLASFHHLQLSQVFGDFVRRQSGTHQHFLNVVAAAQTDLFGRLRSGPPIGGRNSPADRGVAAPERAPADVTRAPTTRRGTSSDLLRAQPTGPAFTRAQLEMLASGKISSVFGSRFERQDHRDRQTRMPKPPLLLTDRVLGIAGEPGSMGQGTVWTAGEIGHDAWYLHDGYVPFGILLEAGHADRLLISWLGADLFNQEHRVCRLIECELTVCGRTPRPGDLLEHEIHIDGHSVDGQIRMFFFHYVCYVNGEPCLTLRSGKAGFFSEEELASFPGGQSSSPVRRKRSGARSDAAAVACVFDAFTTDQVARFARGDVAGCFGRGFELAETHVRSPRIPDGSMRMLHEVPAFDPAGGPDGSGYLSAETTLTGEEWYFSCHFEGDPVMPESFIVEGCVQALSFYLAALGLTLDRDGYRFEVVPERANKTIFRGHVTPKSRRLVYEVFIEELINGPVPEAGADVIVTVDGLEIACCRGLRVRLVPDWPLTSLRQVVAEDTEPYPVAKIGDVELGYRAMLVCAWGKPSEGFGPSYSPFDGTRVLTRLPAPPFLFMSRITKLDGEVARVRTGTSMEAQYDIPSEAWYFSANATAVMPCCAILEVVLQACGWLTAFVGVPLQSELDLHCRNLDGRGTIYRELRPGEGTLTTKITLTNVTRMKDTFIESLTLACYQGDDLILELDTVFGHFPHADLLRQQGVPTEPAERAVWVDESPYLVDLTARPARFFGGALRLPDSPLLMLERITGYWPHPNEKVIARFRGERAISPKDWYFKAHFFQDPVQPGSLGIEAMIQLLQAAIIELDLAREMRDPRFEPIRLGEPVSWKYRGQVLPTHERVVTFIEVVEKGRDALGVYVVATGWTVVDGTKIYLADRLAMRVVENTDGEETTTE